MDYGNYYDRFHWTCPKCGKKFKDKMIIEPTNNDKNNNSPIHKKKMEHQTTPRIGYRKDKEKSYRKRKKKKRRRKKKKGK